MDNPKHNTSSQNLVAIIIIVIGALFLLQSFDLLNFGHAIASWWPLILIIVGFIKLKGSDKTAGAIIFLLGLIFLSGTLDIINWSSIFRFWPLILIFVGLSMLYKHRQGDTKQFFNQTATTDDDQVVANAIFGHVDQVVNTQNFRGGDLMGLFGGVTLNLRNAKISPEGCVLNCTSLFGGIEILVPENVNVRVSGTPIFGGIDNRIPAAAESKTPAPEIVVRCTVAFGGVDISR